ncbi:MAG TPA: transcriptional regulator, partial [Clostridiales bacterium]|nr:transcriptional regulator [Clostridiales bacterium]
MKEILSVTSALSDEIRLRIINILFESDLYVCEMVDI